jgi:hypothetical protein
MSIEAWIVAATLPKLRKPEALANPAETLVERGKLVTVISVTSSWLKRNQSHMFRPPTRRTHARPTGWIVAS